MLFVQYCINIYLKFDMTQTATVKGPEGWSINLLAPSSVPAHILKQSRVSCSSAKALLNSEWFAISSTLPTPDRLVWDSCIT